MSVCLREKRIIRVMWDDSKVLRSILATYRKNSKYWNYWNVMAKCWRLYIYPCKLITFANKVMSSARSNSVLIKYTFNIFFKRLVQPEQQNLDYVLSRSNQTQLERWKSIIQHQFSQYQIFICSVARC